MLLLDRMRFENLLGQFHRGFRLWSACDFATKFAGWAANTSVLVLGQLVEGVGTTECLESLLGKMDEGVGATRCLQYCYQDLRQHCEGECARNPFKEFNVSACVVSATTKG